MYMSRFNFKLRFYFKFNFKFNFKLNFKLIFGFIWLFRMRPMGHHTGEHPCRTSITLRHGCSPVNLLHILRALFPKNTYGGLLLKRTRAMERTYCFTKQLIFLVLLVFNLCLLFILHFCLY